MLWISAGGYCADITRTFPVYSFSPYQQKVYDAVKRLYTIGEKMVKPGVYFIDIQRTVQHALQQELQQLGIKDYTEVNKYMPHGLGHSVGLQVHDFPQIMHIGPLCEGMVLTIEPGIYVPEVCVRIENTIVVTKSGCRVLSNDVLW
ncbi:MAG TPA: aminopeptidase P family protein [Flavobacteriales bacterium]|nr:aminopeptidase P family protein [Flavobacteriales bacterium]